VSGDTLAAEVVEFDETVGWGRVQVVATGEELGFHCLDLVDGSRTILVGTRVHCRRVGRLGLWQATDVSGY